MNDLTTLASVKTWQGSLATVNTTADALLDALISSTSADFLRATGRYDLLAQAYTERRTGDGSCRLMLRHWPVSAVTEVKVAGAELAASPDGTRDGWYLDATQDPERAFVLYRASGTFPDGAPITVAYRAGYEAVPQDIEQAVTEWVVLRYSRKASAGQTQTRSAEGEHTNFDLAEVPTNTQRVINQYKRNSPAYTTSAPERVATEPKRHGPME